MLWKSFSSRSFLFNWAFKLVFVRYFGLTKFCKCFKSPLSFSNFHSSAKFEPCYMDFYDTVALRSDCVDMLRVIYTVLLLYGLHMLQLFSSIITELAYYLLNAEVQSWNHINTVILLKARCCKTNQREPYHRGMLMTNSVTPKQQPVSGVTLFVN